MTLPEICAKLAPVPALGDTPNLSFERSDGASGTLKDYRGKYTVVHFWASWCESCKKQMPALRRLQKRYSARGLAALGLSLDHDSGAWRAALKHLDLPELHGRLAAADAGVSSVPTYWLLDPSGKIIAKTYDLDELATAIAERMK